ncbi:MAG: hypothetical protein D6689_08600 [Deltaproteobacteria bacterium]|nr:MAG: hypothetical protein D6689_08600 [Deltaproteobacteria bacterium]
MLRPILFALVAAAVACRGGEADTMPAADPTPVAPEPAPAAPPPPSEEAAPAAPAAPGEPAAEQPALDCRALCERLLDCMAELSGQSPTPDQLAQAKGKCENNCGDAPPDEVARIGRCAADNPNSCQGMFECVKSQGQ